MDHAVTGEGNLAQLSDDDYFDALEGFPGAADAEGNQLALFDDVVDARADKAAEQ